MICDPAPCDVDADPSAISVAGPPNTVAVMTLAVAAHGQQVTVPEYCIDFLLSAAAFEIENPRSSQAEGKNVTAMILASENWLIVSVHRNRRLTVCVPVDHSTVRRMGDVESAAQKVAHVRKCRPQHLRSELGHTDIGRCNRRTKPTAKFEPC